MRVLKFRRAPHWKMCTLMWLGFFGWIMISAVVGLRQYSENDLRKLRERVRRMFEHAYDGYLRHGVPYDELRPLSCDGIDTWGSYSLTLIDALDTLAVMGNYTEFGRVVTLLSDQSFDADINVSVFETNIRIIGGLLSAHLLSQQAGVESLELGWPCSGPLLRLAEDVAQRLLPAFDTATGMPYGTVNLRHGVPYGETSVTCTAGIGTFVLEFGTLSRLTGNSIYEHVATKAIKALYAHRSPIGLYGNHIDIQTGRWTGQDAGIGAGVDSYYEYLVKGSILLENPALMATFLEGKAAVDRYLKRDDWYVWVSMTKGQLTLPVFQSLEAYWPGLLSLFGSTTEALRVLYSYQTVWRQYGFLPEFFNIPTGEAGTNRENYPLRPELIESVMYLYRATSDPFLLELGENILESIEHSAKTACGYATIRDVNNHQQDDRMESFFLAETTKYLYLLFDTNNFIHNDGRTSSIVKTDELHGECVLGAGGYIFNTEAHPIDPMALRCCEAKHTNIFSNNVQQRGQIFRSSRKTRSEKGRKMTVSTDLSMDEAISTRDGFTHSQRRETASQVAENVDKSTGSINKDESVAQTEGPTVIVTVGKETLAGTSLPSNDRDGGEHLTETAAEISGKKYQSSKESIMDAEIVRVEDYESLTAPFTPPPAPGGAGIVDSWTSHNAPVTTLLQFVQGIFPQKPQFEYGCSSVNEERIHLIKNIKSSENTNKLNSSSLPLLLPNNSAYHLLACRAQHYTERLTLLGEFIKSF
ncbi:ER degradation-enhancing alpha-mannosidase-like protein 2 [Anopheles aquasalis]|uniref:ER degradation-enhancing alpha-mannosidase-like protein 2 n=1 Tax=Anopheles aquasalis TaxID=42839 RepID=UPI00215A855D|nr:ER degradation-enhancing alpha-mannosidase-like protein 2 [Anopheles aquasalis]